jgi:Ca2+/Na+ antiporter
MISLNKVAIYEEKITSSRTEALFLSLAVLFLISFLWRQQSTGLDALAILFLIFFLFFAFYALNYRTLQIHLDREALALKFGLITWRVPRANIAGCALDELPPLLKYGGAGIHFMTVRGRYRASFNFLEYPRLVVGFKHKVGPVQEIAFSTRRPDELSGLIVETEEGSDASPAHRFHE